MSKEQMEEEKDILSDFKKTGKPNVPSDYFSEFQKKMLDQVTPEEKKKNETPITFNMKYLYFTVGIAATAILVFLFINNFGKGPAPAEPNEIVETTPVEQIDSSVQYYHYVEENLIDYETEEIIEMLADNDELSTEESINLETVPSSEVETYLLEEYGDLEEALIEEY